MNQKLKKQLLSSWLALNEGLADCTEDEVRELLEAEKRGERRSTFLTRLHAKLTRMQMQREREELLNGQDSKSDRRR